MEAAGIEDVSTMQRCCYAAYGYEERWSYGSESAAESWHRMS